MAIFYKKHTNISPAWRAGEHKNRFVTMHSCSESVVFYDNFFRQRGRHASAALYLKWDSIYVDQRDSGDTLRFTIHTFTVTL